MAAPQRVYGAVNHKQYVLKWIMATKRNSKRRSTARRRSYRPGKIPFVPSWEPRVIESAVTLVEGKGTPRKGKGELVHYWHIYHDAERVGRVSISWIQQSGAAPYASIDLAIAAASRGRGIGTIAYRKACAQSIYDEVFASIRKSNIASQIAAERAGFRPVEAGADRELRLVWSRVPEQAAEAG